MKVLFDTLIMEHDNNISIDYSEVNKLNSEINKYSNIEDELTTSLERINNVYDIITIYGLSNGAKEIIDIFEPKILDEINKTNNDSVTEGLGDLAKKVGKGIVKALVYIWEKLKALYNAIAKIFKEEDDKIIKYKKIFEDIELDPDKLSKLELSYFSDKNVISYARDSVYYFTKNTKRIIDEQHKLLQLVKYNNTPKIKSMKLKVSDTIINLINDPSISKITGMTTSGNSDLFNIKYDDSVWKSREDIKANELYNKSSEIISKLDYLVSTRKEVEMSIKLIKRYDQIINDIIKTTKSLEGSKDTNTTKTILDNLNYMKKTFKLITSVYRKTIVRLMSINKLELAIIREVSKCRKVK
jgi:hypothetical protein